MPGVRDVPVHGYFVRHHHVDPILADGLGPLVLLGCRELVCLASLPWATLLRWGWGFKVADLVPFIDNLLLWFALQEKGTRGEWQGIV